jgi:hypothetical protein
MTTIKPTLPEPFPTNREWWTCPKTGLKVPMREDANMAYREKLLHRAAKDPVLQRDLLAACKLSTHYWINTFVYTLWEQEISPETHGNVPAKVALHPFILFERQDEWVEWALALFESGKDGLTHKSRDMGASWLHTMLFHFWWLFRPRTQLREMSRVEEMVDSPISKSLFYKHDLINMYLPEWMRPPGVLVRGRENRTSMRIHNALNNSTIAGESTNRSALSGDRCAALLLDEFAKVDNGDSIKRATAAVTPCRFVNSTVDLPGTCYSRWRESGTIEVFNLMAWDHPRKGAGRVVIQDEITKEYRITSPFIEHEIERNGWKEVAAEIYGIEGAVGDTFFDNAEFDKHAALYARKPSQMLHIELRDKISNAGVAPLIRRKDTGCVKLVRHRDGELMVWVPLIKGRLDQSKTYTMGIDLSKGQGGEGSTESVVSIRCDQTGEIVAKWASKTTPPYEMARTVAALALWVGGAAPRKLPFVAWEANGPGWDFGNVFVGTMRYPYYYRDETIGQVTTKKTNKFGWHSSRERKSLLLRNYEAAIRENRLINRDQQSIDQAKTYITYSGGGVGPAELSDKSKADYLGHGDRCIADALTLLNKSKLRPRTAYTDAPDGTWEHRFNRWKSSKRKKKGWQQDFSFA